MSFFTDTWMWMRARPVLMVVIIIVAVVVAAVLAIPTIVGGTITVTVFVMYMGYIRFQKSRGGKAPPKDQKYTYPVIENRTGDLCYLIAVIYFVRAMIDEYGLNIGDLFSVNSILYNAIESVNKNSTKKDAIATYMELEKGLRVTYAELAATTSNDPDIVFAKTLAADLGNSKGGFPSLTFLAIWYSSPEMQKAIDIKRTDTRYDVFRKGEAESMDVVAKVLNIKHGPVNHSTFVMKEGTKWIEYDFTNPYRVYGSESAIKNSDTMLILNK